MQRGPDGAKIRWEITFANGTKMFRKTKHGIIAAIKTYFTQKLNLDDLYNSLYEGLFEKTAVKSGNLLSKIIRSLKVWTVEAGNNIKIKASITYPDEYPQTLRNVKHSPPSTGKGPWGTVLITDRRTAARVKVIGGSISDSGYATYLLNDPNAVPNILTEFDKIGADAFEEYINEEITQIKIRAVALAKRRSKNVK